MNDVRVLHCYDLEDAIHHQNVSSYWKEVNGQIWESCNRLATPEAHALSLGFQAKCSKLAGLLWLEVHQLGPDNMVGYIVP